MKYYDFEDDVSDLEDDDLFESDVESDFEYFLIKWRKKIEVCDYLDFEFYGWCFMNYIIGKLVFINL